MRNFNLSLSLYLCRVFLLIISLICALQVQGQEREVACVYKEEYCASTNRGTSKMLAPARAIVYKQPLSSLTSTILISNLRAGTYKVVLYDSNVAYYSTFIKI
jgi:hypothetical protein